MAVPTITLINPAIGPTGGFGLVEIAGSGFQTWAIPPPSNGPSGNVWPTVEVLFGSIPGLDVAVVATDRLFVRVPPTSLGGIKPAFGEGLVDVTVRNISSSGAVISGESATLVNAYTYKRQQLATETDLGRLVRTLVRELRKQTIANVSITTHSDYDMDPSDMLSIVDVAELPALVIFGPLIQESRFYSLNGTITTPDVGFESIVRRAPDTDDLLFTFVGVTDQKQESISLQSSVRQFFKHNRWLYLERDPANASLGSVKYDMALDASGISFMPPSDQKSNLRSFSGSFVVRGFDHEDLAGFPGGDVVGRTRQVTEDPSITSSEKDG